MKIEGTIVLITGGAQGIGKQVTQQLLEKKAKFVAILDVNDAAGKETARDFCKNFGKEKIQFIKCDVSSEKQLQDAFKTVHKKYGKLDVVINNAGIFNENDLERCISINLVGLMRGTYLAENYMSTKRGGSGGIVINMSSAVGLFPSWMPIYTASKFGVQGFTRSLPQVPNGAFNSQNPETYGGLRCAIICPCATPTQMDTTIRAKYKDVPVVINSTPIKLIADAFIMAIEDDSINGDVLRISPKLGIDKPTFQNGREMQQEIAFFKM